MRFKKYIPLSDIENMEDKEGFLDAYRSEEDIYNLFGYDTEIVVFNDDYFQVPVYDCFGDIHYMTFTDIGEN